MRKQAQTENGEEDTNGDKNWKEKRKKEKIPNTNK
jgi:hypothetical protein